ncbi:MAG TPA: aldehyde dehydrogenase family protein, partial [Planctomycetaceae bacterium]|nr:aldehyde dehydrogenase family protein [Planctomycetaceae bacterium]
MQTNPLREPLERLGVSQTPLSVAIGLESRAGRGEPLKVHSPIDGTLLAELSCANRADVADAVSAAAEAFRHWRPVPAPHRGEFVRRLGLILREHQDDLATIVSWEAGKIVSEARGEVQEMIDICDFAVGLSRQLYGLTIASERPGHRL